MLSDLRYAVRLLARFRGFTLITVASLALGIGANITIFSVAHSVLAQRLPAARSEELVYLYTNRHSPFSIADYRWFRDRVTLLSGLIGERSQSVGVAIGAGEAERATASMVTNEYFAVLGIQPALGRLFSAKGDRPTTASAVAVVSHRYWASHLGRDSSIIGRTVRLNDRPFTVIGVAQQGFNSTSALWRPDFWVSVADAPSLVGVSGDSVRGSFYVTGRLAPGASTAAANAELATLMARLAQEQPDGHRRMTVRLEPARGITAELRAPATATAVFLMIVVGLVLVTACVNVANLQLARATDRRREISIRLSIGATRRRIVRQLLTESTLLAALAGAVALLVSLWTTRLAKQFIPADISIDLDIAPDATVLWFTVLVSVASGILFGLAPALRVTSPDLAGALKDDAGALGLTRSRLRSAFIVVQVATSLVLVVGATLFLRSLLVAKEIDPGFDTTPIVDARIDLSLRQYDEAKGAAFYAELLRRVQALPGVARASLADVVPLEGSNNESTLWLPGRTVAAGERRPSAYFNVVGPDYLATLGIPLVKGRELTVADREGAALVVVVNETMARRLWPGEEPLGKTLSIDGPDGPFRQVVGVARDSKYNTLGEAPRTFMYLPALQSYGARRVLHVRAIADPAPVAATVRQTIRDLDPAMPPVEVRPITKDMALALLPARAGAIVLGIFGALALLLAVIGIYGVTSYAVSQRTRELGIRSALGAQRGDLMRLVVSESMRLVTIGTVVGVAIAFAAARLLGSLLYGISPADPVTFVVAPLILALAAAVSSYLPARRATRVDPMLALRAE
jgi:putative ABC transport system permease protein